jgi:hypothetical protein
MWEIYAGTRAYSGMSHGQVTLTLTLLLTLNPTTTPTPTPTPTPNPIPLAFLWGAHVGDICWNTRIQRDVTRTGNNNPKPYSNSLS